MSNIPEIRDIQYPDGVSIFPLAYGWWIILFVLIVLFVAVFLINKNIKKSKKYCILKKIDKINTSNVVEAAIEMSNILRRVCLLKYKEASVFYGKQWVDFLTQKSQTIFDEKARELLVYAPFMNKNSANFSERDAQNLKLFCKNWIGDNL